MHFLLSRRFGNERAKVLFSATPLVFLVLGGLFCLGFMFNSSAYAAEPVLINTFTPTGGYMANVSYATAAAYRFMPDGRYSLLAFEMDQLAGTSLTWTLRDSIDGNILGTTVAPTLGINSTSTARFEFSSPIILNPDTFYYLQTESGFDGTYLFKTSGQGSRWLLGTQSFTNSNRWLGEDMPSNVPAQAYISGSGDVSFYGDILTHVFISGLQERDDATGDYIHEGATLSKDSIKFEALASTIRGTSVKLQAEVRKIGTPFTGVSDGGIYDGVLTVSPSLVSVVVSSLPNGQYHVRLRAVDNLGNISAWRDGSWREFGEQDNVDFTVNFVSSIGSILINTLNQTGGAGGNFDGLGTGISGGAYSFTPDKDYMLTRFEMDYPGSRSFYWNIRAGLDGEIFGTSSVATPIPNIRKSWEFYRGVSLSSGVTYYLQTAGGFDSTNLLRVIGSGTAWTAGESVYGHDVRGPWLQWGDSSAPQNFLAGVSSGASVDFYGFSSSTALSARNPVVVVPGIVGSRLNRVSDGREVWPSVSQMTNPLTPSDGYLDVLALAVDGEQFSIEKMLTSGIIDQEKVAIFTNVFYGNLLDNLVQNGYASGTTMFQVPYDWRLDIGSEVQKLSDAIATARANSQTGKVDIIAHSMGGLLVKQYLSQVISTDFIDKLIFAGVPNLGAPKALKILNYGDDLGMTKFGLGLNSDEVKKISQNMPAIYELLPSREYLNSAQFNSYVWDFRSTTGTGKLLNYTDTNSFLTAEGRNPALLARADAFHTQSDNTAIPLASSTKFYTLLGCEAPTPTIGGFNIFDNNRFGIRYVDGDGTVPLLSSDSFPEATRKYYVSGKITGADHLGLVSGATTLNLIQNLLQNNPDVSLGGISGNPSDCNNQTQTLLIATHSPVMLHVYDDQGRHLGPNQDGDIEFGIPNGGYDVIEHNSFATVPAGINYRILLEATDTGKFDLDVSSLINFEPQNKVTYLDIPLQSASATATLNFTDLSNPPILNLDNDGNGVTDNLIQPTAILSASSSRDVTPPILRVPTFSTGLIQGATTTLIFSADDSESGVATSSATLNGVSVINGQLITLTKAGQNVFYFEAKDLAGNPSIYEIEFSVLGKAVFLPIADTYVAENAPNKNFGILSTLRIRAAGDNRALIKFDEDAIKNIIGTSTILSAKLELNIINNKDNWSKNGRTIDLYRLTKNWIETGATWHCGNDINTSNSKADCNGTNWEMSKNLPSHNPWAASSTDSLLIKNHMVGPIQYDVTEDVDNFLNGVYTNYGWIIKKTKENLAGYIDIASKEGNIKPELVITYSQ